MTRSSRTITFLKYSEVKQSNLKEDEKNQRVGKNLHVRVEDNFSSKYVHYDRLLILSIFHGVPVTSPAPLLQLFFRLFPPRIRKPLHPNPAEKRTLFRYFHLCRLRNASLPLRWQ